MKTLKNAREIAKKMTCKNIPKPTTLHDWKARGIISDPIDYDNKGAGGGRVGLYPDYVVIEIVTAAELREEITLKKIGEARKNIIKKLKEENESLEDVSKVGSGAGMNIISNKLLDEIGIIDLDYDELLKMKLMDKYIRTFWKVRNRIFKN